MNSSSMNELALGSRFGASPHSLTSRCPSSLSGRSPAAHPGPGIGSCLPSCRSPGYVTTARLAPSASSLYNFLLAASEFSSYRALVPPTSPRQAQPNAHLHDQGKFDPGRRSAAKSETPGHLGNCLSPAIRAARGSGRDSTASEL